VPFVGHQFYTEQGRGFPLLLLHGHTLDHRIWAEVAPQLAANYRVIMPDMAGHGQSGPLPEGATLAGDLADLLHHLGLPRAAVCGLSLGGAAAVSFALHYPALCAALIPVDAALFGHAFPTWEGPRPYVKIARAEGLKAGLTAWLGDPLFSSALTTRAADHLRQVTMDYPGHAWLNKTPSLHPAGAPEAERLNEITAPTLVLVGENDLPDFQQVADRLASAIAGARKVSIPGSGHLLPLEQPAAFTAALEQFLAETTGA